MAATFINPTKTQNAEVRAQKHFSAFGGGYTAEVPAHVGLRRSESIV